MKKILLATSALVMVAGAASAEVTLSGSGRFGIVYTDDGTTSDTALSYRMRVNVDASTETDSGVKFGGRIRMQYSNGDTNDLDDIDGPRGAAQLNAAMLYAETSGFRFEIGNVNTAFDSLATLYNAELGFISSTTGSYSLFSYDSYTSSPYGPTQIDRVGLFASYSTGNLVARVSYIDYDQTVSTDSEETGISLDYTAGAYKIGFGYVTDAGGTADYDVWALLGEYALNDMTNVGLQYIAEDGAENDATLTLYGNTKLASGIGLGAFISGVDSDVVYANDYAIGLGANYDIGGATIAGTIQKGFDDQTYADLGINFSF
ncbi:porin [Tabrizicola sp.]|jgi:outer membrane protein OmpU|uniref:porin n=1 Tax=Tabrizicola sp. TaxID=2005166 RepID=UPI001A504607|nr:porin [Tabrizicola sp.]MBL9061252.1 porin [Tabrizicola sp.]